MHNWNQLQPARYDGMYAFPSVTATDANGKPTQSACTICKANTAVAPTDLYYGTPMLPAGKYVVEVVPPAGYEIVKEEDKNILIGDNFIAPVTQEFGALGNIFILPDQAEVAGAYNANNAQNPTDSLGAVPNNGIVPGFVPEPTWPCVGESRIVPDFISLFPQSSQVAPFAGATRNLCDRKEVTLGDQMGAIAKFYLYTSTHIASKFTGVITDDFTSEFDPFSPEFGEKFAPPDLPVSVRDWTGAEINRVYADQWGTYDGLNYSTWEVNPPNPTGYSPTMMVMCMNDPGSGTSPDPLYNSGYSNFCYELPFMPGQTGYFDTPVVPTSAFSAGYNHPDCAYPDATPAIAEVDGDGKGPWVSAAGKAVTITALGNQTVVNYGYSGPQATTAPFNQKTTSRHYGFGNQGTVTIGGVGATITTWSDTSITVTVPSGIPACVLQQQQQYGGSNALCGQLVVTTGAGKQSIDAVTVTIGGKAPTYVSGTTPLSPSGPGAIQQAIDAAAPGDLIMVPPGTYKEMLIMWKPVRLQGVGAASTVIDANTQPAGKLDPWRQQMVCLFGLALDGTPITKTHPYNPADPSNNPSQGASCPGNMNYFTGTSTAPQVDRLPLEGIVGWDTTTNGNLAQLLQEPTLLGAYEGAGITVLSKGVNTHGAAGYYGSGSEAAFPTGTTVLTGGPLDCGFSLLGNTVLKNPYPSNFQCNPSRIDGLTITDSSQGGGGIFVHAWGHNLEIANNRVYGNIGTLSGGINIGQGESPDAYLQGSTSDSDPGSCQTGGYANQQLPYCFDLNVNVHNNMVTSNTSIGDELFSGTPAGAGGVTFCTGADYYKFQYNWICGNQSTGDGGGVAHLGYIWNGDIEHNTIIFNQSTNPTIQTNGGGLIVLGAAPDGMTAAGVECGGTVADADCPPGLPDGTGPNLTINANLIMGNAAESGSGGGLRLQSVNGTEVSLFPAAPKNWNKVSITNNIISNNVAGWDGAGVSLQDALEVSFVNNTVMSNDTTASSGVLFNTLGAPDASAPGASPGQQTTSSTTSAPQPAGLVVMPNSTNLTSSFGKTPITCPAGYYAPGTTAVNGTCASVSYPYLANDVFFQNRSFYIGVGALSAQYQQNIVSLYNASFTAGTPGSPAASQPSAAGTTANGSGTVITGGTGACTPGASYWDIGIRGDTGPKAPGVGTLTLAPTYSVLTDASSYPGLINGVATNTSSNPTVVSQYCNGARTPPEYASGGYQVPPGISDATVPNPIFNLMPSATVDEGNNWVNISWGPLAETNPVTNTTLGNYGPAAGSPVINYIPSTAGANYSNAPALDFFGTPRKTNNAVDAGAVEYVGVPMAMGSITGGPLAFGSVVDTTTSAPQTLTLHNTGTADLTGINVTVTPPFARAGGTCSTVLTVATGTCTITVVFSPTAPGAATGSVTVTANVAVTGSPVSLSGTGVAGRITATLTPATWTVSQTRNCPGSGLGAIACAFDPSQTFTLTNTGNVPLTGITQGVLGGAAANVANYSINHLLSTCGPAGGGQLATNTTLAPGGTCTVVVQFKPLTAQAVGLKTATISVTDLAGTQTSTLNGTAK